MYCTLNFVDLFNCILVGSTSYPDVPDSHIYYIWLNAPLAYGLVTHTHIRMHTHTHTIIMMHTYILTYTHIHTHTHRLGQCIPYSAEFFFGPRPNPCDRFYTIDVDTVYLPNGRADDSLTRLNEFAANVNPLVDLLRPQCV